METVISADNKNRRGVEANGGLGRLGRLIVVREVLLLRRNSARVLPRLEQNNFPMYVVRPAQTEDRIRIGTARLAVVGRVSRRRSSVSWGGPS